MTDRTVYQSISRMQLITAAPQSTVFQAACIMTRSQSGSVMILDESGGPLGIFTERDAVYRVDHLPSAGPGPCALPDQGPLAHCSRRMTTFPWCRPSPKRRNARGTSLSS